MNPPPDECANCGAEIPRGAHACPECGADERTGWRENSVYDGIDLPDNAGPRRDHRIAWYWWLVGAGLLLAIALRGFRIW